MVPKFPVLTLFLMSILLAGVVTPTINGFQILGSVPTNTYIDFAFAQTEDTEETDDTTEDETDDTTEEETDDTTEEETDDTTEDETDDTTEDETEDVDDEDDIRSLGQEVSAFVHDTQDQFITQKEETKAIIKQCRDILENVAPEERADIKKLCREDLDEVRESYKQLRRTYQDVFKEFRVPVRAIMSGDDSVSTIDAINLRAQQEEFKDRIHDLRIQMREEIKAEVDVLRKQMREEREKMREEMQKIREEGGDKLKEELQSMREKMKEEREQMKEQMKEEREKMKDEREQMKEEQEKMKEESEKTRESEEKSN